MVVRVSAEACRVNPAERPLEVDESAHAGPLEFMITPSQAGSVRVKVVVYQLVDDDRLKPLGGLYFDQTVSDAGANGYRAFGAHVSLQA